MLEHAGFPRLGEDLLGRRDRFLLLALRDHAGAGPRFVDHLLRIGVGLGQDFLVTLLRFGELLLDLVRIQKAFGDSLSALFQHRADRLVGETLQEQRDDHEADDLREENPNVEAKRLRGFLSQVA